MDYKYIEQLIERYFDCQTTLQEEQILRSFFAQEDVPARLMQYADLFNYEVEAGNECLGEEFDEKMMKAINDCENDTDNSNFDFSGNRAGEGRVVRGVFAPFFRAAAVVAVVLTIGSAADRAWRVDDREGGVDNATAVDPYIRKSEIHSVLRIPDVSQAEANPSSDSIVSNVMDKKTN